MVEFSAEALSTFLTIITFAILVGLVLWFMPQFTDMMIRVVEASVG